MPRRYNEDGTMTHGNLTFKPGTDGWWHSVTPDRDQEWVMTPMTRGEQEKVDSPPKDTVNYDS